MSVFKGHWMNDVTQHCRDCGLSKEEIVESDVQCFSVETEDDHEAEEGFELESEN